MEFHNEKTIYLQIADFIVEQILLKKLNEGEKIPSVREMAVNLQVNPNTIARTYSFLEEKGIIQLQRGIGYFVTTSAKKAVTALRKKEFLNVTLPQLFNTMDLLNISFSDFKIFYDNRGNVHEKK